MEALKETTDVSLLEIPKLKIFPCEGNVSGIEGNNCGIKDSLLKDDEKNPSGHHRCWASLNNKEDELWKVSKELFESEAVIFFISVRWGQANAFYQKLIERLNWIENMHTTLGEENVVSNIDAGCVIIGQNWNGEQVLETQKQVYEFYGFNVPDDLSFYWQYTQDSNDETQESYKEAPKAFGREFEISITRLKESLNNKFRLIKRLMDF
jgi:multimeric flavodoxin WrbA